MAEQFSTEEDWNPNNLNQSVVFLYESKIIYTTKTHMRSYMVLLQGTYQEVTMDNKRKAILFDQLLNYLIQLISDEQELYSVLVQLGFAKQEIKDELYWLNIKEEK